MPARITLWLLAVAALAHCTATRAQVTLTQGTNFTIDVSADGRIAMDLLGGIWVLPASGGLAQPITIGVLPAERPRWAPDSDAIVYEADSGEHAELRLYRFADDDVRPVGDERYSNQQADWHPDGDRIVFTSQRHDSGLDLWELDLPTGLSWRISSRPGDEQEPVWSADGRHLVYINQHDDQWSLILRRFGEPDRTLLTSDRRLSAPAWRPDGSLITFMRHAEDGLRIHMLILSNPVLERTLIDDADLFVAPVAWLDRQRMLYAANGVIRLRRFNSRVASTVPFRATIARPAAHRSRPQPVRELPVTNAASAQLVVRAARLFDGTGSGYREQRDIVIAGGRIEAIEKQRDRTGFVVVDMGDLTVLPGYIDTYAALPPDADATLGPALLSCGVTTLVAKHRDAARLNEHWAGEDMPGPRVLAAAAISDAGSERPWLVTLGGDMRSALDYRDSVDAWLQQGVPVLAETWQAGLGSGASLLLGGATLPASPQGHRYQDLEPATGRGAVTIISGLADAQTPTIDTLLASRQAKLLKQAAAPERRFTKTPDLAASSTNVVLGSKPNGLAPGIGLHAEFRALVAAGLTPKQALQSAGVNAAAALGLGPQVGRIAVGSVADLVIVDGDPLGDINDALKVVGVIRNGRFFSTIGLIDRLNTAPNVE